MTSGFQFEQANATFLGFGVSTMHNVVHAAIGALGVPLRKRG